VLKSSGLRGLSANRPATIDWQSHSRDKSILGQKNDCMGNILGGAGTLDQGAVIF